MTVLYFNVTKKQPEVPNPAPVETTTTTPEETPTTPTEQPTGKIKADTFTGILQSVDTGCFADGECSVTVDGKHVTLLVGRSQQPVGSIIGAPSIGDLEKFIGKPVEVYARDNSDGTYSLYGSDGFYVKVLGTTASSTVPSTVTSSTTANPGACIASGCSGELCVDAAMESSADVVSNCIYKSAYACYKTAKCERQKTGECGWTKTPTLTACLANTANEPSETPMPQ